MASLNEIMLGPRNQNSEISAKKLAEMIQLEKSRIEIEFANSIQGSQILSPTSRDLQGEIGLKKQLDRLKFENDKKQKIVDLQTDIVEDYVNYDELASIQIKIKEFNDMCAAEDKETETILQIHWRSKKEKIFQQQRVDAKKKNFKTITRKNEEVMISHTIAENKFIQTQSKYDQLQQKVKAEHQQNLNTLEEKHTEYDHMAEEVDEIMERVARRSLTEHQKEKQMDDSINALNKYNDKLVRRNKEISDAEGVISQHKILAKALIDAIKEADTKITNFSNVSDSPKSIVKLARTAQKQLVYQEQSLKSYFTSCSNQQNELQFELTRITKTFETVQPYSSDLAPSQTNLAKRISTITNSSQQMSFLALWNLLNERYAESEMEDNAFVSLGKIWLGMMQLVKKLLACIRSIVGNTDFYKDQTYELFVEAAEKLRRFDPGQTIPKRDSRRKNTFKHLSELGRKSIQKQERRINRARTRIFTEFEPLKAHEIRKSYSQVYRNKKEDAEEFTRKLLQVCNLPYFLTRDNLRDAIRNPNPWQMIVNMAGGNIIEKFTSLLNLEQDVLTRLRSMSSEILKNEQGREFSSLQRFKIRTATMPESAYKGWQSLKMKSRASRVEHAPQNYSRSSVVLRMDQLNAIYAEFNAAHTPQPQKLLSETLTSPTRHKRPTSRTAIRGDIHANLMEQALFRDERRKYLQRRLKQNQPNKSKSTPRLRTLPETAANQTRQILLQVLEFENGLKRINAQNRELQKQEQNGASTSRASTSGNMISPNALNKSAGSKSFGSMRAPSLTLKRASQINKIKLHQYGSECLRDYVTIIERDMREKLGSYRAY